MLATFTCKRMMSIGSKRKHPEMENSVEEKNKSARVSSSPTTKIKARTHHHPHLAVIVRVLSH